MNYQLHHEDLGPKSVQLAWMIATAALYLTFCTSKHLKYLFIFSDYGDDTECIVVF